MELGLHAFVDLAPGQSPEHHRHEYLASAPAVRKGI